MAKHRCKPFLLPSEKPLEKKYCAYCRDMTPHHVLDSMVNKEGTGRKLECASCGSARLGEIQGFDAALM